MRTPKEVRRPAPLGGLRLRVAATVYAVVLAIMTLPPIEWSATLASDESGESAAQLVPVVPLARALSREHRLLSLAQVGGNVLLLVPFGFLAPLLWPRLRGGWRVVAAGAATSLAIELWQLSMPHVRQSDVNDLIANTLGAALGWVLLRAVEGMAERRRNGRITS